MKYAFSRVAIALAGLGVASAASAPYAFAETIAVVMVCPKGAPCNEQTARSIYHIPLQGMICFVPIQQELAKLNVYDETKDDIKIKCRAKG
ncbi:MAG: hypothetical protein Q7T86_06815 [Hyphomicrobiaceae bacterium]|nr:hypothetical protein [Hyphomicrobiaceae bacterium]